MIVINLLNKAYEYDVRSLTQAFLGNDIQVNFIDSYDYSKLKLYEDNSFLEESIYVF